MDLPASRRDDEARLEWEKYLPAERVMPFGMKDNFWEMCAHAILQVYRIHGCEPPYPEP